MDRRLGNYTGWLGREWVEDDTAFHGRLLNTAGYPTDLSAGGVCEMHIE